MILLLKVLFTFNAQIVFHQNPWRGSVQALDEDLVQLDVSVHDAVLRQVELKRDDVLNLGERQDIDVRKISEVNSQNVRALRNKQKFFLFLHGAGDLQRFVDVVLAAYASVPSDFDVTSRLVVELSGLAISGRAVKVVVVKEGVPDASSRPFLIAVKPEIALVVAAVAVAVFDRDQLLAFSAVEALGVDHPAFVDLLPPEETASMLADRVVGWGPAFVIGLRAVPLKYGAEIDVDDDPVDGGGAPSRAEDGEDDRVLAGFRQKSENSERFRIEDEPLPLDALVGGVEQLIGRALRFEVLDSDNDASVVSNVEVVGAFQNLS